MRTMDELIDDVRREAEREEFPVEKEIYERAKRNPAVPILFAGSLTAPICVLGRDLGKDEVASGEPLIGAGGRLVRVGIYEAWHGEPPPKSDRRVEAALGHSLLTNTVPYKPPGNKAYSSAVKERFRPYVAELLAAHWKGKRVLTLGTEAFQWFAPYADPDAVESLWGSEDRYESELSCVLTATRGSSRVTKELTICPLPHPSPLNARWYKRFPELLAKRLAQARSTNR